MNRRQFIKHSVSMACALGLGMPGFSSAAPGLLNRSPKGGGKDALLADYFEKIKNFNQVHPHDVFLPEGQRILLHAVVMRLQRLEESVGHANFHLISFDEALQFARQSTTVGPFSPAETEFLESVFYAAAKEYGFLGEKPVTTLTETIPRDKIVRVPSTGNFLFKGMSEEVYMRIRTAVGEDLLLTSGIRGIVKQYALFLHKVLGSDGNYSLASRSLAPPGYSYHGIGDFDVGQLGYGALNFTAQFAETRVFRRLRELGYLNLRYTRDNTFGVRFEPWHIQVVS